MHAHQGCRLHACGMYPDLQQAWHAEYDKCSKTLVQIVTCMGLSNILLQCILSELQVKADVNDIINAFCTPDSFKNSSKVVTTAHNVPDNTCMIKHLYCVTHSSCICHVSIYIYVCTHVYCLCQCILVVHQLLQICQTSSRF